MNELIESERSELQHHEQTIEKGLKTFVDVGNALLAIRDKRLYRQNFGTFEEYCRERWELNRSYAYEIMDAASTATAIRMSGIPDIGEPATVSQARPLARLEPEQKAPVWQKAVETAPNGKPTAAHVEATAQSLYPSSKAAELPPNATRLTLTPSIAPSFLTPKPASTYVSPVAPVSGSEVVRSEVRYAPAPPIRNEEFDGMDEGEDDEQTMTPNIAPTSKPHVAHNSGNNEWYTPKEYIEAARQVMGWIDLDPATSETANGVVQADEFYTAQDDGLAQEWTGKVWMNPPYSDDLIGSFAEKITKHFENGDVTEAIVLVNNGTETRWFQRMAQVASCICFPKTRVKFWRPQDEKTASPLQGQAILYFGTKKADFVATFRPFGFVGVINGI